MSWLLFNKASKELQLFAGEQVGTFVSRMVGAWEAHNDTASSSGGPWPHGTYKWSTYKQHADQPGFGPGCFATAYGCQGIHIFSVQGRSGMGVHGGRTRGTAWKTNIGGKTLGCIRTSDDAMAEINKTHNEDPLIGIIVA